MIAAAFYKFVSLPDFASLKAPLLKFCEERGVKGTILLAAEGINGTIAGDASRVREVLDYLRRDSYFAGLAQNYDDRVFRYFTVSDGHLALNMTKHGMERPDASSEVIQLLRMRYFLTERVYYHHTKVVAGAMISKAVELALDVGSLSEADLMQLNDWTLLERLRTSISTTPGSSSNRFQSCGLT